MAHATPRSADDHSPPPADKPQSAEGLPVADSLPKPRPRKDADLEALRERDDFKRLVAALKAATKRRTGRTYTAGGESAASGRQPANEGPGPHGGAAGGGEPMNPVTIDRGGAPEFAATRITIHDVPYAPADHREEGMTEAQWRTSDDPQRMMELLGVTGSQRKFRLFSCACCRRVGHLLENWEGVRRAIAVAERFADGGATAPQLAVVQNRGALRTDALELAARDAREAAWSAARAAERAVVDGLRTRPSWADSWAAARAAERQGQATLLRDCFGNPFRAVRIDPCWLRWNDATVRRIAEGIYEEWAFGRLPILADALLDAGCDDEELLQHCRAEGPHVRGCWAVDAVLGKA